MRVLLLATMLMLSDCATLGTTAPNSGPPDASVPVSLSLTRRSGHRPWSLSDERGNVVLLDVWATWCEPCRDALPMYGELEAQFGHRGLRVYAINVDEDAAHLSKFLAQLNVSVPVLLDPGALNTERALKVRLMPTSYLIDRHGLVRQVHEGVSEDAKTQYQHEIEALLSEPL